MFLGLLTLLIAGCGLTPESQDQKHVEAASLKQPVAVNLIRDKMYFRAPVEVNGEPMGSFLIDTGAAMAAMDLGLVRRLELPVNGDGRAIGIAGTESFNYHRVESLAVGGVGLKAKRIAGMNMYKLHRHRRQRLDGILGYPTLAEVPFALDGPDRTLTFYPRRTFRAPDDANPVRLIRFRNLPTVEATIGNGHRIWLVLDTGSDEMLSLPDDLPARWPDVLSVDVSGMSRNLGVGGMVHGRTGWVSSINVFGHRFKDVEANFAPPPSSFKGAPVPVGRIGNGVLRRFCLTFDRQRNRMWAELDQTLVKQSDSDTTVGTTSSP
ncbi:hypothetical protein Pan265_23690 [Mucisphaera calidilacus]|uniref:Peptidase A2 domain-containing protein n=2 Tax=Mucisphaera calidilacus TaxID=2527982 RepID=A0A518BZV3_9BACT|nr:hypothetical protein Pan265_23690 [Mucisphaera calidilacus]